MKKKTVALWKRVMIIVTTSIVFFGFFYVYGWTDMFTIQTFSFKGVPEHEQEKLNKELFSVLQKKTFYVFPGNKILTLNGGHIKKAVYDTLPNTRDIFISLRGLHTVHIQVVPHIPLFRVGEGTAYDVEGVLYEDQNDLSNLPTFSFSSTTTIPQKEEALFLKNLKSFIERVDVLLFPVGSVIVDEYSDVHIYASGSPSRIMITRKTDTEKAWLALVSAVDTEPLTSTLEKKKSSLEYIDLRFGSKVFYKFTNDQKPAIIPEHVSSATTTISR